MKGLMMIAIIGAALVAGSNNLAAENVNPFGLVYENAITENIAGKVNIHPVTYKLHGIDIAANVYTPANYDSSKSYPAIVVAHPNGGVKEQVAGLYAERLAENGYITIAADASYQGASGGEPRHTDKPAYREEDIHGMVDYISQYAGVDANRLGILGICGGGGYTLKAAQSDKRLKAVATLSMFNTGRVRRNGYADSQLDSVQTRLAKANEARVHAVKTGEEKLVGSMAGITDEQAEKLPFDLYREGFKYYLRTHAHPNSTFEYTESSLMDLMAWDATNQIELINQPLLIIAGENADSLYMSEDAYNKATGTNNKELYLIPNATHIQAYFVPEYVQTAEDKLVKFFSENL
ncbi:MAG: alpha/beta hydrolase [Acetobacter sp.]|nr:alpha/beta hydrolase [Acetobacter sp.]